MQLVNRRVMKKIKRWKKPIVLFANSLHSSLVQKGGLIFAPRGHNQMAFNTRTLTFLS